ncbi:MAG: TnsA endonuclease N-terminal domain-containing protein [Burkholderiaceae bacterium]|nr:TnsA endonuclease N-terminal domain-containing protein [Burkholderiaceae bacterium]
MDSCEITRLVSNGPVRKLRTSRRCLTGKVAQSNQENAGFESSLERDWLVALDFDPSARVIRVQPFSIYYEISGETRRYTPDVLVEYITPNGSVKTIVYEVKPQEELRDAWQNYHARFKAAVKFCRANGWRFKIVTEQHIRTPFVENAQFLRRYRNLKPQPLFAEQLLYTLRAVGETTPQALLAAAYLDEQKKMAALPELWRMVATRMIGTFLDKPLTMQTPLWLIKE